MTERRIPLWVKLVYTGYVGVVVPYYWVTYTPWNFLYFCDIALLTTCPGMWLESPLLISMQAVGIALPQMLWVVDYLGELLFGVHVTGVAHYMFNAEIPVFVRGLSSFHGWLPFVLLWLLTRVGYDRRALRAQLAVVVAVLLVSFYLAPAPPIPAAHPSWAVNINYVHGFDDMHPQTKMAPLAWLTMLGGIAFAMVVLTHLDLSRAEAGRGSGRRRRSCRRSHAGQVNGRFDPSLPLAFRIADNFGVSVEEVFDKTDV